MSRRDLVHDNYEKDVQIEMLDNLYQIAEQERDAALTRAEKAEGLKIKAIDFARRTMKEYRAYREQNVALRSLVLKYQQWSFTLSPLSDMEEVQRNELADEAEHLGCREGDQNG